MTNEEIEYEVAKAHRLAFMSLSNCERDWLIYKKLGEIEDNLFELNEKLKGDDYMTNGDRIRQMSNEELAKVINDRCFSCSHHWKTCDGGRNSECEEGIKAYLDMEVE